MERLKFRAWYRNQMYEVYELNITGGMVAISLPRFPFIQDVVPDVVMQLTGLKDKNGDKIYEGDIVTIYDPYTKRQHTDAVIWDDVNCRYAIKNTYIDFDFLIEDEVEVIGNIYENPDLL